MELLFFQTIAHYLNSNKKFDIRFDAIKKLLLAARCARNLYECALSANNADSTL